MFLPLLALACTTNYEPPTNVVLQSCCDLAATGADTADTADSGNGGGTDTSGSDTGTETTFTLPELPVVSSDPDCQATPAPVALDPEVLWAWPDAASTDPEVQVSVTPVVAPLFDTDGDGFVSAADTPQVVFTSYTGTDLASVGKLRVLDGLTGEERVVVGSFVNHLGEVEPIRGVGGVALGDLDGALGDGRPEVCVSGYSSAIVCFTATVDALGEPTLAYRWSADWRAGTAGGGAVHFGYPSLADLDGDGSAEVMLGHHVWSADGVLVNAPDPEVRCDAPSAPYQPWGGPIGGFGITVPYEVDGDAAMELVAGGGTYDIDVPGASGGLRWCQRFSGYPAVADVDGNGEPDVVTMNYGRLFMTSASSGAVTSGWPGTLNTYDGYPSAGPTSPPVFADLDGDHRPELAITGVPSAGSVHTMALYDQAANEILRWTGYEAWGMTGFDFEGDGLTELIVSGGSRLHVLGRVDGAWVDRLATGTTGWDPALHEGYGQRSANVSVANVDGVGGAEIVVPNAIAAGHDPSEPAVRGIVVLHAASEAWKPARPVWNQHAYSITNVNDDATIPATPIPNVEVYNTFRVADSAGVPSYFLPAVGIGASVADPGECEAGSVTIYVAVSNAGANVATNVEVRAVNDAGAFVSVVLASLAPGASAWVSLEVDALAWGNDLTVVVDPADSLDECGDATEGPGESVAMGPWPCGGR